MKRALLAAMGLLPVVFAAGVASAQNLEPPPPMTSPSPYGTPSSPYSTPPSPYSTPPSPYGTPPSSYGPAPASDESEDSGLGLEWIYVNADLGFAYTNMASFNSTALAIQQTSSDGAVFGLGAGVRLLFFTLGVRARDLQMADFNLWEIDGEAAFHIRIWRIDPYFGVRGGYAFVGALGSGSVSVAPGGSSSDVSVHGVNLGPMFGIDVYLSKLVSLGAEVNAEVLLLQRPPAPLPPGVTPALLTPSQQQLYQESGSSAGLGVLGTAHVGLHF